MNERERPASCLGCIIGLVVDTIFLAGAFLLAVLILRLIGVSL